MPNNSLILPTGWGDDPMSEFQARAFNNELATYVQAPQWQQIMLDVEMVLQKCTSHVIQRIIRTNEPSAILLFLTAHNQYLASARLVSSGHCLATYPTGRAVVESAIYSWYLSTNQEAASRWNNKPVAQDELRHWNNEFRFSSLTKSLASINKGTAEWAKYLHQTAIDFGAHPNKDALYSNMKIENSEDRGVSIKMMYLHEWDALFISTAKFAVETGMIAIQLFAFGFPDDGKSLNLTEDLRRLTVNLRRLQEAVNLDSL